MRVALFGRATFEEMGEIMVEDTKRVLMDETPGNEGRRAVRNVVRTIHEAKKAGWKQNPLKNDKITDADLSELQVQHVNSALQEVVFVKELVARKQAEAFERN